MQRLRLYDCRLSRLPRTIGACSADIVTIADYVNTAQRRLLFCKEAGDESWHGTWAEIAFNVSRSTPCITLPRGVARLEAVDVCQTPVYVHNQFFEYMIFGNGRMPKTRPCLWGPELTQTFARNFTPTFRDLNPANPQLILVYPSDAGDTDGTKRILFQGLDQNGVEIVTQDGPNRTKGIFVPIVGPFATSPYQMTTITGIQKDVTDGPVQVFAMDPSTGVQTLLVTMEPGETTAWYRRYFLDPLPFNCCRVFPPAGCPPPTDDQVQVTAIAKLDLIPVVVDTDYCLIQNLEAIIEECQSIRYSEIDSTASKAMAQEKHKQAIGLLNGELTHFYSMNDPDILVQPFGSARLDRVKIGMI